MSDPSRSSAATDEDDPQPTVHDSEPGVFRFNLDDALARLNGPHTPIRRFTWSSVTPSTVDEEPPPTTKPTPSPRSPAAHRHATPGAGTVASPDLGRRERSRRIFDGVPEIQEATPPTVAPSPWRTRSEPQATPAPTIVTGGDAFAPDAVGFVPEIPYAPNVYSRRDLPVGEGVPRLPDAPPAAAPPMATMVSPAVMVTNVPRQAIVNGRRQRKRRRLGRIVLLLLLLGGAAAGALVYGHELLFPEEWDEAAVPVVEVLQSSTGLEFVEPVPVVTLPPAEYAAKVSGAALGADFGPEWTSAVPRWRALGLVDGEPTAESVNAVVAAWMPAFYDPSDGQIYRSADVAQPEFDAALRSALATALVAQHDPAPPDETARSLADEAIADTRADLLAFQTVEEADRTALAMLPVPISHRLIGIEELGVPILRSLGVTPDRTGAIAGFDAEATGALDVPWSAAPVPVMVQGDAADGASEVRGSDFWFTVLAAYLPAATANDAANAIAADLYTPAVRGAQQCVYATFAATSPDALGVLQISLLAWAEASPTQAAAQATLLADGTTLQLSTCDPGTAADATRLPDVASALVARQTARLGAG